jgi:PAS domain S-box-containing protein
MLGQTARLSNALYIQANIFERMQQYDAALAALAQARQLNVEQGQTIDVAFDDQRRCSVLLAVQNLDAAENTCRGAETVLAAADRLDLVSVIEGSLAQIDLLRHRPTAALERLNRVLGSARARVPAKTLPKLYGYRSEAFARVGRFREAMSDLQEAQRLDEASDATRRAVASTRLKDRATTEIVQHERDALDAQVQQERLTAAVRAEQYQGRLALATTASLGLILVASVLWSRVRHERALRRAAETLEAQAHILSSLREGVLLVDSHGKIRFANPAAASLLGQPAVTLMESVVERIGIRMSCLQSNSSEAQGGVPVGAHELHLTDADGKPLTVLLTYSTVTVAQERLSVCILLDVTELRRLEREVLADVSGERGQLSREVHEGLAQDLTGIALLLSAAAARSHSDVATLGTVLQHVNKLLVRTRALAVVLSPVQVAGGSLSTAVLRLADHLSADAGIDVSCHCDLAGLPLTLAQADHIYRIAQDCARLAARSPGTHQIWVSVQVMGNELTLAVEGDGAVGNEIPDESVEWGTIAYLARVMGGVARAETLPTGRRRRVIAIPVSDLAADVHPGSAPMGDSASPSTASLPAA